MKVVACIVLLWAVGVVIALEIPQDDCPVLVAKFSACVEKELSNGGCVFDNNTGYLDYCKPCGNYYQPWIS
jgi:hypothetical protein